MDPSFPKGPAELQADPLFFKQQVKAFRDVLTAELTELDLGPVSGEAVIARLSFVRVSTTHSAFFSAYERVYYSTADDIWGNPASVCNWLMLIPFLLNNTANMNQSRRHRIPRVILKILFSQRRNMKFWTLSEDMLSWFTDIARAPTYGLVKSEDVIITVQGLLHWKKGCMGMLQLDYGRYVREIGTWIALILGASDTDAELEQGIPLLYLL